MSYSHWHLVEVRRFELSFLYDRAARARILLPRMRDAGAVQTLHRSA